MCLCFLSMVEKWGTGLMMTQGTYTVFADAYTARPESKKIICLEATVTFA